MDIIQYNGYEIHAVPCELADTGLWQTRAIIPDLTFGCRDR